MHGMRFPTRRHGLFMLTALAAGRAHAAEVTVSLATATPGGGFPAFGDAFAGAIHAADPSLVIAPRASGGSAANIDLLRSRVVDLALVQGAYAYPALGKPGAPTVLAPMYSTPGLFVVRRDSGIGDVADLKGRPVALGTRNSGLTVMGRAVLAASGLDPARDIVPILLDHAGDGPAMVLDGRAAALWGGGLGWPGFVAVADAPGGARFLAPSSEAIAALTRADPALKRLTVPADTFRGQNRPIATMGSWSFVLARPDFPAELGFRIVHALAEAQGDMQRRHPQGGESDPRRLLDLVPADVLSAGTSRYLAEVKDAR